MLLAFFYFTNPKTKNNLKAVDNSNQHRVLIIDTLKAGEGTDLGDGNGNDFSVFVNYI